MPYAIIQPPFTLKFREMSKPELKSYYEWFMKVLPERVSELEAEVRHSPTHALWRAEYSPESLVPLGDWFVGQVETRARTSDEIAEIKGRSTISIEVSDRELTNRTYSLAMDIGMYLAQVLLKGVPSARWDQPLSNKKFVDYGQPVIMGLGSVPLNPIDIVVTLSFGIVRKTKGGNRLRELYDIWAKQAKGT